MKRRMLAIMLTTSMLASLLVGCGDATEETKTSSSEKSEATKSESSEGDEEVKELTTIKILCDNTYSATQKVSDWEDFPVSDELKRQLEEIGLRIELECIDSGVGDVIRTRMASGVDLPDLIASIWNGVASEEVAKWGMDGLIYSVDELVEQYDEDDSIRTFYNTHVPHAWNSNVASDGKLYWFSYLYGSAPQVDYYTGESFQYYKGLQGLQIRADWVEAVGEELKDVYTPEELFALLKKMRDEDANGNGTPDEVVNFSIGAFSAGLGMPFGLHDELLDGYSPVDKIVTSNFYHENFPAYIEFLQSLYENELYDTATLGNWDQMINENRASLVAGPYSWPYEDQIVGVEGVQYMPILLDLDGDYKTGVSTVADNYIGTTYGNWIVPKSCENVEAVMKLMDYVYSEKYAILDDFGLEGTGYEIDENGSYVSKLEYWDTFDNPTMNLFGAGVGMRGIPAIKNILQQTIRMYDEEGDTKATTLVKQKWEYMFHKEIIPYVENVYLGNMPYALATDEEYAVIQEHKEVLQTYAAELLTALVLGEKSLEDLDTYLKEMDEMGMQEYLSVQQARCNRLYGVE